MEFLKFHNFARVEGLLLANWGLPEMEPIALRRNDAVAPLSWECETCELLTERAARGEVAHA